MKRAFQATVLAGLTLLLFAGSAPAAAADWAWGAGFRIGGFHFKIGHRHDHGGYGGAYYRVTHRIPSRHRCTDRCYVDRGVYYHHASCPVVHGHFRSYGSTAYRVYDRYAPRLSYRYDRYDRYKRYGRYDRYDRRNHRYDRRYRHDKYYRKHHRDRERYDRRHRHDDRRDRYERRDRRNDRRDRYWRERRNRRHP